RRRVCPRVRVAGTDPARRVGEVLAVSCGRRSAGGYLAVEGAGERATRLAPRGGDVLSQTLRRCVESSHRQGCRGASARASGDHVLLGGDNMDLALAHHAGQMFAAKGIKLDAGQMHALWHSCRLAKETIFASSGETAPIVVLGRGSKVIGGTIKGELARADVE